MDVDFVSLMTDYGLSDGFVAAVHGAILRIRPTVRIIDVTHDIHPGDVARGAAVLAQTVAYLPRCVHVAVVDPGVGTERRAVALRAPEGFLVGPDNGLLIAAAEALGGIEAAVSLTNPAWHAGAVTATFHGRDIFGPVAGHLAAGEPFEDAGDAVDTVTLIRLPDPVVRVSDGLVEAEVRAIDRFGNVQLAAPASALERLGDEVTVDSLDASRARAFGDVPAGGMVVFVDSAGFLAVAVNRGRAVVELGVEPGEVVRVANRQSGHA